MRKKTQHPLGSNYMLFLSGHEAEHHPRAKKQLDEQAKSKGYKVTIGQEYKTVLKGFSYVTHPPHTRRPAFIWLTFSLLFLAA